MEILIGHCTWIALLRREVLAIFHAVYKFVRRYGDSFAPLWDACREEIRAFRGVMVLLESDWGAPWSRELWAYDACPSGMGACVSKQELETV